MRKPSRLSEVAKLAGVAPITASRAIRGEGYVSEEARARIMEAAAKLNYAPDMVARRMRGEKSKLIGIFVNNFGSLALHEIAKEISSAARARGYDIVLFNAERFDGPDRAGTRDMLAKLCAGLILPMPNAEDGYLGELERRQMPCVFVNFEARATALPVVVIENHKGARTAVEHLLSLGHRRIAFIAGSKHTGQSAQRQAAYVEALHDAGIAVDPTLIVPGLFNQNGGNAATQQLLALAEPPTAIFAANDEMAFGAIDAIHSKGLRVPADISVIGFDDIATSSHIHPPLTTMRQPVTALGACAVGELVALIEGGDIEAKRIQLPLELIVRQSTGPGGEAQLTMKPVRLAGSQALPSVGWAGLGVLLLWLMLGDLGVAMRDRAALPSALEMLRQHEISDTATSLLLSTVPAVLSLLLVPPLGYYSDRCRSHFGRRTPFLLATAAIGCLAMLGLASAPALARALDDALGSQSPGPQACQLTMFCLFWTAFSCAAIGAHSLFNGLVNDLVPARLLGRFFAAFRIVSLSAGIAYHNWIFALTDHHLSEILVGVGLLFGLPILIMALTVKEPPLPPAAAEPAPRPGLPLPHVLDGFQDRRYGWAVAAFVLAGVTFCPFNTFYLHFAHAAGVEKSSLGALTAAGYAVSIASAFAIGWLADRFGALRVSTVTMVAYCAASACGFAAISDAASFRAFYFVHVVISGAWFTAAASMPMALFPRTRFVQLNTTKDLMVMFGLIFVSTFQGPMLDLSAHDYRLTLLAGAAFSLLCLACLTRLQTGKLAAAAPR